MTVCIAAICEGGKKIVSATDGLLTFGGVTADILAAKMHWFGDWKFMYAGVTSNVGAIWEELRQIQIEDQSCLDREKIADSVSRAYERFVRRQCTHAVLSPLGLTLDELHTSGIAKLGEVAAAKLHDKMLHHASSISEQLLVTGWGAAESSAMLLEVNADSTSFYEENGCACIGTGAELALSTLLLLGQSRDSTLADCLYRVAAAKFMSESSPGENVGRNTTMHVSWKRSERDSYEHEPGKFVSPEDVAKLRIMWLEYGKPKIPDQVQSLTTSIATATNGGISTREMIGEIGAAMRLANQSDDVGN